MTNRVTRRGVNTSISATLLSSALPAVSVFAQGAAPIKIGFGMALTGPLAPNGQQALLGSQIWAEEVNGLKRASCRCNIMTSPTRRTSKPGVA